MESAGAVTRRFCFQAPFVSPIASLPQECEKELLSLCHSLFHQSLICSWDQGKRKGHWGDLRIRLPTPSDYICHPRVLPSLGISPGWSEQPSFTVSYG